MQGEIIENVANELENILRTGEYHFQLSDDQSNILLIYQSVQLARSNQRTASNLPLGKSDQKPDSESKISGILSTVYPSSQDITTDVKQQDSSSPMTLESVEQRWTREQISDFVRKLGFLETEREGGDKIKRFLHLHSVSISRHGLLLMA